MDDRMAYSVRRLAERWRCSEGLIYKLIHNGELLAFRPGNLIRISAAEVDRFEGNEPSAGVATNPLEIWSDDD